MTEPASEAGKTAGALLRAARERQGLHIAALAAAIKVAPRKLDALEHDRYDELPDATFTRALAQTVCRTLKIDARPVLALLPQPDLGRLEHVAGTLNTPYRDRPGRDDSGLAASAIRPLVWASAVLMVAALVMHFLPTGLWESAQQAAPPASAVATTAVPAFAAPSAPASAVAEDQPASAAALVPAGTVQVQVPAAGAAAPTPSLAPAQTTPATPAARLPEPSASAPATLLQLRASAPSWVKVEDGRGQQLLSRTVQPGESVDLDGALPLRLTIGNAAATQVGFRGMPVDLQGVTRDNVARVELK
jgi:cytoskeleton protein RodZ